jgi:hypothetical protein
LLLASLAGAARSGPADSCQRDASSFGNAADVSAVVKMIGTLFDANGDRVAVMDSVKLRPASILRLKRRTGGSDEA